MSKRSSHRNTPGNEASASHFAAENGENGTGRSHMQQAEIVLDSEKVSHHDRGEAGANEEHRSDRVAGGDTIEGRQMQRSSRGGEASEEHPSRWC